MTRGAGTFLGISVPKQENALLAAGYPLETLILYVAAIGLGQDGVHISEKHGISFYGNPNKEMEASLP